MDGRSVRDDSSFLSFYDETVVAAYRYAARLTGGDRARAEDLVQDAFSALFRHAKAGTVAEASIGWLRVTIRHRFLDQVRAAEREERRIRLVWPRPDIVESPEESDPLATTNSLSDRERAALTMRYVDDLPVAEVAAALHITVRATESLLMRAKARARAEVRDA